MKQYEKDLKQIISSIDETPHTHAIYPFKKDVLAVIGKDSYHLLLVRGYIEECKFDDIETAKTMVVRVTPRGYAYFMEKQCFYQDFWRNTIISIVVSALSGIVTSLIFNLFF